VPKWLAAARPEGLTVGLIQSVASPRALAPFRNGVLSVGLDFHGALKVA
jgi:hypothetical protein